MNILVAPNAFKNSLSAEDASLAICTGLEMSTLNCLTESFPVGDGGDGTMDLIIKKFRGLRIPVEVSGPLGRKVKTSFGLIHDSTTAVIEMADASGIRLLEVSELNPFSASSYGTGEMILKALDQGVSEIILGLGGSATVDAGAGILNALGVRFLDSANEVLEPVPDSLRRLVKIDTSRLDPRINEVKITVLCDVDNVLLGENGAASIFGPQKGAKQTDLPDLESVLKKISELVYNETGKNMSAVKHGGAAGGSAAALYAMCNAALVSGAEEFLRLTNFDESLEKCQLLITGEGSLDEQTLQGKAPFAVASHAIKYDIPVIGLGGSVPLHDHPELNRYFNIMMAIGNGVTDLKTAMQRTEANLIRTGTLIGNLVATSNAK